MTRQADPSDADALAALHRASIAAHCRSVYSVDQIDAWLAVVRPQAYSALIDSATAVLVAEETNGTLLGLGVCSPDAGLINACYVAPGLTRRGVGRTLMHTMEALLFKADAGEARLNSTLNAVGFYRSVGYRSEGPTQNRLPSGVDLPCVAMSKPRDCFDNVS